jgi:hypothetical protein
MFVNEVTVDFSCLLNPWPCCNALVAIQCVPKKSTLITIYNNRIISIEGHTVQYTLGFKTLVFYTIQPVTMASNSLGTRHSKYFKP